MSSPFTNRRAVLAVLTVLAGCAAAPKTSTMPKNTQQTFVLIHGAWHGAWCWDETASILREGGHRVSVPTLAGLGGRAYEDPDKIDLETHIRDVVAAID